MSLRNYATMCLKAGGLVLEKTDKIALVSEDLYPSPTAVKVSYCFRNLTNADTETIVAFPMPDVTGNMEMMVAVTDPASGRGRSEPSALWSIREMRRWSRSAATA
jgi:hypothetical protein